MGGLTVVRELQRALPDESFIYFGDTARVPYGSKSAETLRRFSRENTQFLVRRGIKQLIVACNSASAVALETLEREYPLPILGVVRPGALAAVRTTKNKKVGVIGTRATIESGSYERAVGDVDPDVEVFGQQCPLFVPLAEEAWTDGDVVEQIARTYLGPLLDRGIDTLILGCTHYPLLEATLQKVVGETVSLIDTAVETVRQVEQALSAGGLLATTTSPGTGAYFVTDSAESFRRVGQRFLGEELDPLEQIDQSDLPWYER